MTISVGNLLREPEAQSFVSVEAADAYLLPEANAAWMAADVTAKEAALVRASRWIASAFTWRVTWLDSADLATVGKAVARLAVEALSTDLYAANEPAQALKREKYEGIEFEYRDAKPLSFGAAGKTWPWLLPMLGGFVMGAGQLKVTRS